MINARGRHRLDAQRWDQRGALLKPSEYLLIVTGVAMDGPLACSGGMSRGWRMLYLGAGRLEQGLYCLDCWVGLQASGRSPH